MALARMEMNCFALFKQAATAILVSPLAGSYSGWISFKALLQPMKLLQGLGRCITQTTKRWRKSTPTFDLEADVPTATYMRRHFKMEPNEQLNQMARRLVWWQPSEITLANAPRFLMQVMTLGSWNEVEQVREAFGPGALRDALLNAEPGVFDGKSWSYWHVVFGIPERPLPGGS